MATESTKDVVLDENVLRELQLLDASLSDVSTEVAAKEYLMARDILAARQQTIAKIPDFWGVVFDAAYTELEAAVTPTDRKLLGYVSSIEVVRPEIPASAKPSDSGLGAFGEPRSVAIRFTFAENEWLADSTLEKVFWYRYGRDGFAGLVSDPVKVHWKPGKDLTHGLTDAAYALWQAQKANPAQQLDGAISKEARRARDKAAKEMPEYKTLVNLLDREDDEGVVSFFNFWSFRGRWTSAAESAEARAEIQAKRQKAMAGQSVEEDEDEDDEDEFPEEDVETFANGGEVAAALADDIWPNAIDYFLAPTIDSDFEDDDDDDEDDDEENDVEMS